MSSVPLICIPIVPALLTPKLTLFWVGGGTVSRPCFAHTPPHRLSSRTSHSSNNRRHHRSNCRQHRNTPRKFRRGRCRLRGTESRPCFAHTPPHRLSSRTAHCSNSRRHHRSNCRQHRNTLRGFRRGRSGSPKCEVRRLRHSCSTPYSSYPSPCLDPERC